MISILVQYLINKTRSLFVLDNYELSLFYDHLFVEKAVLGQHNTVYRFSNVVFYLLPGSLLLPVNLLGIIINL